jgi:hypothetical protein
VPTATRGCFEVSSSSPSVKDQKREQIIQGLRGAVNSRSSIQVSSLKILNSSTTYYPPLLILALLPASSSLLIRARSWQPARLLQVI